MTNKTKLPNPGSDAAKAQGCVCPQMDNAYGRGYLGGVRDKNGGLVFIERTDCPIHGAGKEGGAI